MFMCCSQPIKNHVDMTFQVVIVKIKKIIMGDNF